MIFTLNDALERNRDLTEHQLYLASNALWNCFTKVEFRLFSQEMWLYLKQQRSSLIAGFMGPDPALCKTDPVNGISFWMSGRTTNASFCNSTFNWTPKASSTPKPLGFTNWMNGQPKCSNGTEWCTALSYNSSFKWRSYSCSMALCPLCEYIPYWSETTILKLSECHIFTF